MEIVISEALAELASHFPELYIVGGCVRNSLLGFAAGDIDLASPLNAEETAAALEGTPFTTLAVSPRLGTLLIYGKGLKAEYTAFRCDSYPEGLGSHSPDGVVFTRELEEDARRRDFSVNALYYAVNSRRLVDPLGGLPDLENKILRAAVEPKKVFSEDGLRIMRLARFAAELGFTPEADTLAAAKKFSKNLADIAVERIFSEFMLILKSDLKYGIMNAPKRGVEILVDTGAMKYIIPELIDAVGEPQNPMYHKLDVYRHILECISRVSGDIRLAALFHDIGKPPTKKSDGNTYRHAEAGAEIADMRLKALRCPAALRRETVRLVRYHMLPDNMRENKMRLFILDNLDIVEKLIELKRADSRAGKTKEAGEPALERVYKKMLAEGAPMSVADLQVDGRDLIELGVPERERGTAMHELLRLAVNDESMRGREAQLEFLKKRGNRYE